MVILGGSVSSGAVVNDGGRYDPVGDSWTPTSVAGQVPSARESFAAVRAANEILVWGGTPVTASGARYCLGPCTLTSDVVASIVQRVSPAALDAMPTMLVAGSSAANAPTAPPLGL